MRADRELVASYLEGDQEAFEELHARHTQDLLSVARRIVPRSSNEDAEDVVQEAWLHAIRALARFRWQSALKTWLVRITLNLAWSVLRDRLRRPAALGEERGPEKGYLSPVCMLDLNRAISRLPREYQRVLVLHAVAGYSHREIGTAHGIEAGTSKSRLSRARESVRAFLEAS